MPGLAVAPELCSGDFTNPQHGKTPAQAPEYKYKPLPDGRHIRNSYSSQHPAPMLHAIDTWNTAIADSPSPEIADSDDATDKRPPLFVFDVFAEDYDGLVSDIQPRVKRRRRASSASSSVRTG